MDNRADRVGDIDSLFAISFGECFDEFMADDELMVKTAGMHEYIEIDAGLAKGVEAYRRFDCYVFIDFLQSFFCDFDGYAFDQIEIAAIGNADGDFDDDVTVRHTEIGNNGGSDFLVWNDDHIGVAGRHNSREAPSDVSNASLFPCAETDGVADTQLFG